MCFFVRIIAVISTPNRADQAIVDEVEVFFVLVSHRQVCRKVGKEAVAL